MQIIDIDSYEFEDEEERILQAPATSSDVDINSLLVAMMEKMQVANQKLFTDAQETSRTENQKLLTESQRDREQKLETMQAAVLSKFEKKLEATSGKLQEKIHFCGGKGVTLRKNR